MNTVRFARLALIVLLILVFSWTIPHYFWKAFDVSIRPPRVSYSPVTDQFLLLRPENKSVRYEDLKGKEYTREEYERLLPLASYRQLAASGQMPDSLRGVKLDLKEIALNNLFLRIMPADIGMPQIPLFPLFESRSGRVRSGDARCVLPYHRPDGVHRCRQQCRAGGAVTDVHRYPPGTRVPVPGEADRRESDDSQGIR